MQRHCSSDGLVRIKVEDKYKDNQESIENFKLTTAKWKDCIFKRCM